MACNEEQTKRESEQVSLGLFYVGNYVYKSLVITDTVVLDNYKSLVITDTVDPPNTAISGNGDIGKRWYRESYIANKKHVRDLKISGGIGGGGQQKSGIRGTNVVSESLHTFRFIIKHYNAFCRYMSPLTEQKNPHFSMCGQRASSPMVSPRPGPSPSPRVMRTSGDSFL